MQHQKDCNRAKRSKRPFDIPIKFTTVLFTVTTLKESDGEVLEFTSGATLDVNVSRKPQVIDGSATDGGVEV
ncbi:hypothetical protein DPMN_038728 [Dreissena polymorpha]|uniref:Uncharacterized protein n=1 Tax=Dreissena polymorpha TaxID=45954 RepID=A0A9D4RR04_DREPO|nr:hypothetical protein DPMN_038728 [Dreissena polymorpha]